MHGIGEDLVGDEIDSPCGEQGGKGGGGRGSGLPHHGVTAADHLSGNGVGVEAGNDGAAVEEVLIDLVFRLFGDASGMEEEKDLDYIGVDVFRFHAEIDQIEGLFELLVDDPGLLGLLSEHHGGGAGEIEGGHDADDGFDGSGDFGDGLGDLVFQQGFLVGIEEGNGDFFIESGDGNAEVEVVFVDALAGNLVEIGGILGIGIGLWIEGFDAEFSAGEVGVFFEEIIDAADVDFQLFRHVGTATGSIVADDDVSIEFAEDGFGAVGQGMDFVFGEIEAPISGWGEGD